MRAIKLILKSIGVCFVGIIAMGILVQILETPEEKAKREQDSLGIQAAMNLRRVLPTILKSPSTASMPAAWNWETKAIGKNTVRVSSYVDSQNGFGAMIRTNFTAVMTKSGDKWTVDRFDAR